MARKVKVGIVLVGLAAIAFVVGGYSFKRIQQRKRVKLWVERARPIILNLAPEQYYKSYADWSRAGQAIPDIERTLIEMYKDTDPEEEKGRLLYAMGAIPRPGMIEFLVHVMLSSESEHLRAAALNAGVMYNEHMEIAQRGMLDFARDPRQPVRDRCVALGDLIALGNRGAIEYGQHNGRALLDQAEVAGVNRLLRENLLKQIVSSTSPTSEPTTR